MWGAWRVRTAPLNTSRAGHKLPDMNGALGRLADGSRDQDWALRRIGDGVRELG